MIPPATFTCAVAANPHDGDTWRCADGRTIRLAGVDANELDGTCHNACAPMPGDAARVWLDRLIYRQRLTCQPLGSSYRRIVARCSVNGLDLSCAAIQAGAAIRWDRYWRLYGMEECR